MIPYPISRARSAYGFLFLLVMLPLPGVSQDSKEVDPIAIALIDKMGEVLGDMEACSFLLSTVHDEENETGMLERSFDSHRIYMRGPDRFTVRSQGNKGTRGYWYNGAFLTWYSFDENNFVTIPAPATSLSTIDSVNATFGLQFPGADILYPSFGDDILEAFSNIRYAGIKSIGDAECFHIIAENDTHNFQLWIENGAFYLPRKYLILRKGSSPEIFEGTFESWDTGAQLPDGIFEFTPPKNADLISIMPKS